ncbi:twin-arginine translocase subunit TatC, partial [Streptomyces sp. MCAF7]
MLGNLRPTEIVLILVVILLLFGAKKLPDMARSLGKSARILKSEAKAMKKDDEAAKPAEAPTTASAPADPTPQAAPRTIQAAPGDVTSSRPVTGAQITANGLLAPFTIMLKVSLMTGVVISSPVWLYQLWAFLAPGLHNHEKKYAIGFVAAGAPLFLAGAWLAYAVLPTTAGALVGLTPEEWTNLFPADEFFDIVTRMVIVFGLAFELPLLLVLLNFGGVITGRRMLGWWRGMVVGITVFAAIATPTG